MGINTMTKTCPFCGEDILAVAIVCKHCQRDLSGRGAPVVRVHQTDWISTTAKWGVGIFFGIILFNMIF